ncbi:MAG: tRNA glutamyl-Q synthetase [Candidatus Kapaibacterium sp.]|nr:MAG: tRNA glutamyl-Q synthetase [Candidatus Kapabacteria bacterium]
MLVTASLLASQPFRSRIAPTPSGFLHRGNAFSFVLTWLLTRSSAGGSLHLRIDDLDAERIRPEYIQDIFETLEWLGVDYDSGPRSVQDFDKNWSQKRRVEAYTQALARLREQRLVFACECSRRTVGAFTEQGLYTGICRTKELLFDEPNYAWRFRSESSAESHLVDIVQGEMRLHSTDVIGDAVLRRKDGIPAYHIASLVDDELDGINFIVRGQDLLPSSVVQQALARHLGYEHFLRVAFLHHPLLLDGASQKLSKSKGADSLKAMRENAQTPHEIYQSVALFCGISAPIRTITELLNAFASKV